MSDHRPAVSARGVLDGEPAALARLCDIRGPSVIAYCTAVCGPERGIEAAAVAFGAFRAAAVGATRPLGLNPDALLLAKAREAAAAHAPDPPDGTPRLDDDLCSEVPRLLAGAAEQALAPADRHRLRRHLARCVACRAAQRAQQEAERAYVHPPAGALTPIGRQAIIAALRHAAPLGASSRSVTPPPRPRAVAAMTAPAGEATADSRRPSPPGRADQPSAADAAVTAAAARPPHRTARPSAADAAAAAAAVAAASDQPGPDTSGPARVPSSARGTPPRPGVAIPDPGNPPAGHRAPVGEAATGVIPVDQIAASLGYAGGPPEEPWPADPAPYAGPTEAAGRSSLTQRVAPLLGRLPGARVVAPAAVLVVALLIVLAVAGVFSSGHAPTSSPTSSSNSSSLGSTTPTTPTSTYDHSPAAHAARLHAARLRRAARRRAARKAAAAAAAANGTGAAKTGATAPVSTAAATTTPAPPATVSPTTPTARVLAAPAATAAPATGAPPAASGGYRAN